MKPEHQIVGEVMQAKQSSKAANDMVCRYLPFIKAEVRHITADNNCNYEDCLSIAMFAFHEAVMAYNRSKGAFLPFASIVIKNRLIDYKRKESRHNDLISIDAEAEGDDTRSLLDKLDTGEDNIAQYYNTEQTRDELNEFALALKEFGLDLSDIMDNCPKQNRTLDTCHRILEYAKENYDLINLMLTSGRLPITQLSKGTGVSKKLIERHRKYLVAILLAYTNGFEIIRGHLNQMRVPTRSDNRE